MSILVGSTWIFAVIDVEDSNLIFAENVVKGINYTVKVVDNVISGIVSVAGIKADPETVLQKCVRSQCLFRPWFQARPDSWYHR